MKNISNLKGCLTVPNCHDEQRKFQQQVYWVTWFHLMTLLCIQTLKVILSVSTQNIPYPATPATYTNVSWDYRLMCVQEIGLLRHLSGEGVVMVLAINQEGAFM